MYYAMAGVFRPIHKLLLRRSPTFVAVYIINIIMINKYIHVTLENR